MRGTAQEIADFLIREHGPDRAMDAAIEGVAAAHNSDDNYQLSIWRQVKRILRERSEA